MSIKNNVLLVGATGFLGSNLLNGLTFPLYKDKFNVSALIRKDTINSVDAQKQQQLTGLKAQGVNIITGDLTDDEKSLAEIINTNKIDTILSAARAVDDQLNLLSAAKTAGNVKLFIPSDFGFDVAAVDSDSGIIVYDAKLKIRQAIVNSGIPYLFINSGAFTEVVLSPFIGVDVANSTITAPESFEKKFTTTSLQNIGLSTAALILSNTRNQAVYLADSTVSYNELADTLDKVFGKKFERKTRNVEVYKQFFGKPATDFAGRIAVSVLIAQKGGFWPTEQAWNYKNTNHYSPLEEVLKGLLARK